MTTFEDSGPQLDQEMIDGLQAVIGEVLPDDYCKFLLSNNGGRPVDDRVDIADFDESPTDLNELFGQNAEPESSQILWNREVFSSRLSSSFLPIGCDSIGNIFCLCLEAETFGSVLYFDMDGVFGDLERKPRSYIVASSFRDFVAGLGRFE